jgi:hypothetical protein
LPNISEDELRALNVYQEVETDAWLRLRYRITVRGLLVLATLIVRGILVSTAPEHYAYEVFVSSSVSLEYLTDMIFYRTIIGVSLACLYGFALYKNHYLRSVSMIALMAAVALLWGDLQMFLLSSIDRFSPLAYTSLGLRIVAAILLALNYFDVRR